MNARTCTACGVPLEWSNAWGRWVEAGRPPLDGGICRAAAASADWSTRILGRHQVTR